MSRERGRFACNGKPQGHADGLAVIELLLNEPKHEIAEPAREISRQLSWLQHIGAGRYAANTRRFNIAVRHVMDGVASDGKPCCGYLVHYRGTGRKPVLSLIDPAGQQGGRLRGLATLIGHHARLAQHHTENRRMIAVHEGLADDLVHATPPDKAGARINQVCATELERFGDITPETLGEFMAWATAQQAD